MSNGEDAFSKFIGTILGWLLLIYGVCWVVKWLLAKIVENAGPLIMVGVGIAGVAVLVAMVKAQVALAKDRAAFMKSVGPALKALEEELSEKQAAMKDGGWERERKRLEAKLAANRG